MGYPRKSYPHRCSPPCAKRARPRACARVYIIYRSLVGRSGGVSAPLWPRGPRRRAQGGGGRRQRRTPPRAATRTCPAYGPVLARLRPRTFPAYGLTVRKGGSTQGNPRSCPCVLPATACLRPRPCPLMGEVPSAGWGRAKAKADAPSRSNPHFPRLRLNHCAQRRKCTRQSPPLPVRTPRDSLPTAVPPPADGRSAVRTPRVSPPTAVQYAR